MSEEFIEIKETNGAIENEDNSATTEETKEFTLIEEIKREIEKITSSQNDIKNDIKRMNDSMYNIYSKGGEKTPEKKDDFNSFIERL